MPTISELRGRVAIDDADYQQGLQRVERATEEAARQMVAEWKWLGQQSIRAAREAEREQTQAARELAREVERAARQSVAAVKQADRESATAAKQAAREREDAAREAVREQMQLARQLESAEKEAARAIAQAHKEAAREATAAARQSAREQQAAMAQARQNFGAAFGGAGTALTYGATVPVLAGAYGAVKVASDVVEQTQKVEVLFGQSAKTIEKWANTTVDSLGLSERHALTAAGSFGNLFHILGLSTDETAKMSMRMTALAADLASFNNLQGGTNEGIEKLTSGLVGQVRPLREVGIFLSEARVKQEAYRSGIAPMATELTEQQKILARYSLILRDSTKAQGDYARTHDQLANSARSLMEAIDDEAGKLGKELIPIAKDAVKTARELLAEWNKLPDPVKHLALEAVLAAAALGPLIITIENIVKLGKGLAAIPTLIKGIGGAAGTGGATGASGGIGGAIAAGGGGAAGAVGLVAGAGAIVGAVAISAAALDTTRHLHGVQAAIAQIKREAGLSTAEQRALIHEQQNKALTTDLPAYLRWIPAAGLGPKAPALTEQDKTLIAAVRARRESAPVTAAGASGATPATDDEMPADPKKLAKEAKQTFDAQVDQARALALTAPEDRQAQEEATRLIPILQARQADLKKEATEAKDDAEKLAAIEKASAVIDLDIAQLRHGAEKERAANAKKQAEAQKQAQERFRQIRIEALDADVQAARDEVAEAAPGTQARKAADLVVFALEQKKAQVVSEAQALVPQFSATGEAQLAYSKLARQAWGIVREQNKLGLAAFKEEEADAKKAAKDREASIKAYFGAQQEMAKSMVEALPEKQQAAAAVKFLIPALKEQQDFVVSELQSGKLSGEEYLKEQKAYWDLQADINHAKSRAADVEKEQLDKAKAAQKKAIDDARHLASARVSYLEAEVKNFQTAFGGSAHQAARYVLPALVSEFQATARPVKGEDATERLQRLTEGQSLEAKILDTAKKAGLNVRKVYAELQALSQIGETGHIDRQTMLVARSAGLSPRQLATELATAQRVATTGTLTRQDRQEIAITLREAPMNWQQALRDPASERILEEAMARIMDRWKRSRR